MAVELRNRLEASLGVSLSATLVYNYPTVAIMAPYIADKIGLPLGSGANGETSPRIDSISVKGEPKPATVAEGALTTAEIKQLSDEDAEALLLKELEDIDF